MTSERGSAAVELVLVTPVLLCLLLLAVAGGRIVTTKGDVAAAARSGARAASIARTPVEADVAARTAVTAALAQDNIACASQEITVDRSQFHPGGWVTTSVSCRLDLGDLTLLGIPTSRTIDASFTEPIDAYRGAAS